MNCIYRTLWNDNLQQFVVAPETARSRGERGAVRNAAALALASLALSAQAMPTGGQVSAGQGSIAQSGAAMTVTQGSPNLSLNWQSFSIAPSESVRFAQPNASSIALNRVLGSEASQIFGKLQANGQVFLLNPNGVLFGRTAQVDVGGLVASTLRLSDADFLSGKRTFSGNGGSVVNQGSINSSNGYVALLGGRVSNQGTITAQRGTVALAAGNKVTLDFAGDKLLNVQVDEAALNAMAENKQLIQADGGTVVLTTAARDSLLATAVNNDGVIEARTLENHNGVIRLLGGNDQGSVQVSGTLDASAPNGGDGGFVETSAAHVNVADSANITTAAPQGKAGTWLIDPRDYTIAASGGDITGSALGANLNSNNVTILSANGATAGNGDILVNDNVAWSANTRLTLSAERNIDVNAVIAASGNTAGLTLTPGAGGTHNFGTSGRIDLTGTNPSLTISGNAYAVINDVNALQNMSSNLAGHYALGSNIDASATVGWNSGAGFAPVGTSWPGNAFTGAFEGLNHTISGLVIQRPSTANVGLFGVANATLANVGLVNANIMGGSAVGALAGLTLNGGVTNASSSGTVSGTDGVGGLIGTSDSTNLIQKSHSSATVSGTGSNVGGLIGYKLSGTLSDSYSTGSVSGDDSIGGLVGRNYRGDITGSYSTGSVSGGGYGAGGLIGYNNEANVENSYSTGTVTGDIGVGGVVGILSDASVTGSHSTGAVNGNSAVGGLVGSATTSRVTSSYSTGPVTGITDVGGLVGFSTRSDGATFIGSSHSTGAVSGTTNVGGLVGHQSRSSVSDSYSTGPVTATGFYAGGLVGLSETGGVADSYSTGTVSGVGSVGGLVGGNVAGQYSAGSISNSHSSGAVSGGVSVGGLVGTNQGSITYSYSTGPVSSASNNVGGLVGANVSGTVSNSYSTGAVTTGLSSHYVGGLVGLNASGNVTESYSTGAVNGSTDVTQSTSADIGGLIGYNVSGDVSKSYSSGAVTGLNAVGGLIGNNNNGTVANTYSTGAVTGNNWVGGLVGYNQDGSITTSYSTGAVSGVTNVGGLVGYNTGSVTNSFWDTQTSGQNSSAGGIGLTTKQMQTRSTYTAPTAANGHVDPGWDFKSVWTMEGSHSYPQLQVFVQPKGKGKR